VTFYKIYHTYKAEDQLIFKSVGSWISSSSIWVCTTNQQLQVAKWANRVRVSFRFRFRGRASCVTRRLAATCCANFICKLWQKRDLYANL